MRHRGNRVAANVHPVDRALVDAPRDDGVAGAVVGILADPARAEDAAVADFEQTAFQVIAHATLHRYSAKEPIDATPPAAARGDTPLPRGRRRCRGVAPPCNLPKACSRSMLPRSEEHTSELQSRSDLVCRLLLEKKKNKNSMY